MGYLVAAIVGWAHRRRMVVVSIAAAGLIGSIEGTRRLSFDAELAPVILAAAGITLGRYGTPIWPSYPPLRSIGIVSAASTIALAVASVLVLPALLLSAPGRAPAEVGLGAADVQAR